MSDYDIVAIDEAHDDAVAARFNLQLGMLGNVHAKRFPKQLIEKSSTRLASRQRCS